MRKAVRRTLALHDLLSKSSAGVEATAKHDIPLSKGSVTCWLGHLHSTPDPYPREYLQYPPGRWTGG